MVREPLGMEGQISGDTILPGATSEGTAGRHGDGLIDDVRAAIARLLSEGSCSIRDVAAATGMSVRTFQRRLAEAGLTYSAVLDDVRFAETRLRLARPRALLKQVAVEVGFCEPASFTRACRRWTGLVPREYQRRLLASGQGRAHPAAARPGEAVDSTLAAGSGLETR